MGEADEQKAVIEWCAWKRVPVFHIPNGGSRHPAEAARPKAQGVKAGVPDLCIPVARGGYHSLYIEMKAPKGHVSQKQHEWLSLLREQGMRAIVCYGADNAIKAIEAYMRGKSCQ